MRKICIFQDTETLKNTIDLLEAARRLYGEGRFVSFVVIMDGSSNDHDGDCFDGAFHHIIHITKGLVDCFDSRGISDILFNLLQRYHFDSILIPETTMGKMIAPRLAKKLGTGLISGVIDIKKMNDAIEIIRTAYSGKVLEGILYEGNGPIMMAIRPNAFDYHQQDGLQTQCLIYNEPVISSGTIKRLHSEKHQQTIDIRDSEILISGGGGVKDIFSKLFHLADALNGTVSASRKLVDQGIAHMSIQVGQSGKTVSPRLYMALGIHGTMQHIAGLRNIESIVSVNTNCNAPICTLSDIVVHGDAATFMDKLMANIAAYRSEE